MFKDQQPQNR